MWSYVRMKYYDEKQTAEIRKKLEEEILQGPGATTKKMFGSPTFFRGQPFFAFLVTKGIVITKLSEADRATLAKHADAKPFEMTGAKVPKSWIKVSLEKPEDIQKILPFVKKRYAAIKAK
jgi:hypothetical protein